MESIQNIKGIFFDLYGTLLIYGDMKAAWVDWFSAFYSELRPLGLSLSQEAFTRECDRFFGKEPPQNSKDGFTVFENRIQCLCDRLELVPSKDEVSGIADHIAAVWEQHVRVDPETATTLGPLGGAKALALVSNFDHPRHSKKVISRHQLQGFFQSIIISGEVGVSKPNPRIFELALKQTGLDPSEVVYVGDTADDVIGSQAAGILPVLIQRSANNPMDQSAHAFRTVVDGKVADCSSCFDLDAIKISSLKELMRLVQ